MVPIPFFVMITFNPSLKSISCYAIVKGMIVLRPVACRFSAQVTGFFYSEGLGLVLFDRKVMPESTSFKEVVLSR